MIEKGEEREKKEALPSSRSLLKVSPRPLPGLSQAGARNKEILLHLPHVWQRCSYLSHHPRIQHNPCDCEQAGF